MIKTIALSLCVLGLAVPVAGAQAPSQTGYGETHVLPEPPTGSDITPTQELGEPPTSSDITPTQQAGASPADQGSGSLPFTGLDVGIVVLAALILLAVGVGLRRTTAKRSAS